MVILLHSADETCSGVQYGCRDGEHVEMQATEVGGETFIICGLLPHCFQIGQSHILQSVQLGICTFSRL